MLASSIPTLVLVCIIFGNLKTGLLFSFDSSINYIRGPWYMLMYFSALCHLLEALRMKDPTDDDRGGDRCF